MAYWGAQRKQTGGLMNLMQIGGELHQPRERPKASKLPIDCEGRMRDNLFPQSSDRRMHPSLEELII